MRLSDRGLSQLGPVKSKGRWQPTGAPGHRPVARHRISSRVAIAAANNKRAGRVPPITLATIKLPE